MKMKSLFPLLIYILIFTDSNSQTPAADLFWKGSENLSKGNYKQAISNLNQAIELNPSNYLSYLLRGNAKEGLKDFRGAITDYTKAIDVQSERHPKPSALPYYSRGNAKNALKDYVGAISDYSKAIEFDPQDYMAYVNRGVAKESIKDFKGAIADYTKSIELNPKDIIAYKNRGLAKWNLGLKNDACLDFSKAGELGDDEAYEIIKERCQ